MTTVASVTEHRVSLPRQTPPLFFATRAEFATSFIIQSKRAAPCGALVPEITSAPKLAALLHIFVGLKTL